MAANAENVFSALRLSHSMVASLPEAVDEASLESPCEAMALLAHACMLAVGFRLIGLSDDGKLGTRAAEAGQPTPLPSQWRQNSPQGHYAFRYAHDQSSLEFVVKVSRMGGKAVINGLGVGDDKVYTTDLLVQDFISSSSLPFRVDRDKSDAANAETLRHIFISPGRLTDAGSLVKLQIIQKLAPGIRKDGYEDSAHSAAPSQSHASRPLPSESPYPQIGAVDPLRVPTRPQPHGDLMPPGFDDEYDILRPAGRSPWPGPGRPLNIGERDLYPQGLGPHDPLNGGGFGPARPGGGMHPSHDDPIFPPGLR